MNEDEQIVERKWTAIADEGWEYYWDPADQDTEPNWLYWRHVCGFRARGPLGYIDPLRLAYEIQRCMWGVEKMHGECNVVMNND